MLYYLAANPRYVVPMRQEINSISRREGWPKDALDTKMSTVDTVL